MLRSILGTIVGLVIAGSVVGVTDFVNHTLYPPSEAVRSAAAAQDFAALRQAVGEWLKTAPRTALILVPVGWIAGAFCGALAATAIARARGPIPALVIAGFLLVATAMNLKMIPHPLWVAVAGLVGIPAAALAGWWFVPKRPVSTQPQPYDMRKKNMAC